MSLVCSCHTMLYIVFRTYYKTAILRYYRTHLLIFQWCRFQGHLHAIENVDIHCKISKKLLSRVRNCVCLSGIFGCETVLFYRVRRPCTNAHRPKCRALRRPQSHAASGEHGIGLPRHRDAGPSSSNHSSARCGVTFGRPTQCSAVGIVAVSRHRFAGENITPQWV